METTRDEESPFFDCWDGKHEQSDVFQQVDPWVRNAPKSKPNVEGRFPVNFLACSVCWKLGVYQHLPIKVPQYDISSEGEGRPDDNPIEVAPSGNSNDEEWWPDEVDLNTVTIGNVSIDSKPVETADDWPIVDLKPSEGSVKGLRYVGPGDENIDNLG